MAMAMALRACPFCGTHIRDDDQSKGLDKWLQVNKHTGPLFDVECFGCGGAIVRCFDTEQEAIDAWNRRLFWPSA